MIKKYLENKKIFLITMIASIILSIIFLILRFNKPIYLLEAAIYNLLIFIFVAIAVVHVLLFFFVKKK